MIRPPPNLTAVGNDAPPPTDLPEWMSAAFSDDSAVEDGGVVAEASDFTDNNLEATDINDTESSFNFAYDFDVKPAWMRGADDDNTENSDTFTPPWMRED